MKFFPKEFKSIANVKHCQVCSFDCDIGKRLRSVYGCSCTCLWSWVRCSTRWL